MTVLKKLKIGLFVAFAGALAIQAAERLPAPLSLNLVSQAEARVGRPLTPVSVAGVGRRTVRRCAVGVYYC
jgi:hypothetical protein